MPLRIAIVGSGVSGLSALWALQQTNHEVHLFEAKDYFGGHVQTIEWKTSPGRKGTMIDVAFMLFNRITYPNFTAFLSHLGISVSPVRVTFGFSRNGGEFEWSSTSLSTIFLQGRNILSLKMWRMLFDIWRFNLFAPTTLEPDYKYKDESVGGFLRRNHYSVSFQNDYLVPLVSSLWIHDPEETLNSIPMLMLSRYLRNHRLLQTTGPSVEWLFIEGGAKRYVDEIISKVPVGKLHKKTAVSLVRPRGKGLLLQLEDGSVQQFDKVILATRASDALKILGPQASRREKMVLEQFRTSTSAVFLHSDTKFMPRNQRAWAVWNYHDFSFLPSRRVSVTANLNLLQGKGIPQTEPMLATLNPYSLPDPSLIEGIFHYEHPVYDGTTLKAQQEVKSIQGFRNIWFAGAWLGYGFHEDGFTKGIEIAQAICPEIDIPFDLTDWKANSPEYLETRKSRILKAFAFFLQGLITVCTWMTKINLIFSVIDRAGFRRLLAYRKDA